MSASEQEKLISKLTKDFGFWKPTAIAFIEASGKCVYCGENLYSDRLHYYSQNIDHVYPKAKYPDLANEQSMRVPMGMKMTLHSTMIQINENS